MNHAVLFKLKMKKKKMCKRNDASKEKKICVLKLTPLGLWCRIIPYNITSTRISFYLSIT